MTTDTKIVISASRRTDIPAFYLAWFMKRIKMGFFEVANPFNQRVTRVPATPDKVHTIVFWSKNFHPFLREQIGERLQQAGYNLFFNFSVNSHHPVLEPNVPPLTDRLGQMKQLCDRYGSDAVTWRFDPICFFQTSAGMAENNLHDFAYISEHASQWGIKRCITSFMDHYPKIKRRLSSLPGFEFVDPPLEKKLEIILNMENELTAKQIQLSACCEKKIIDALPPHSTVTNSSCIPNDLLLELYGGHLSLKKDTGQRGKAGCGCKLSVDIGSYRDHPCYHNCLFCYANPASGHEKK
jgi:hypothetical protein